MKKNFFLLIISMIFILGWHNLKAGNPVKYQRFEMNGFTKWTQTEIDALIKEASHIGKSITETSGGYKTNDFTLNTDFTVNDGVFTMTAKADFTGNNGMGFKNADRGGKLAGEPLGAYPANFFCDLTKAEGIRFKIDITNGTVKTLNIGLSNCANNCYEYFVYGISTADVDEEGYITIPFESFKAEFWSNNSGLPLNNLIVFIIEAIDATNGASISFSDIHGYKIIDPKTPLTLEIEGKKEMCEGDANTLRAISEATEYKWTIGEDVVSTENHWDIPSSYKAGSYTVKVDARRINEDKTYSDTTADFTFNIYAADKVTLTDTAYVNEEYNHNGFKVTPTEKGDLTLTDTLTNVHGCDSIITLKLIVLDRTGISDYDETILSVYPNPSNGIINIRLNPKAQSSIILLYDLQGRLLINQKATGETVSMNIGSLNSGLYLLKVENQIIKIIKR